MSDNKKLLERIKKLEGDVETLLLIIEKQKGKNKDIVQMADLVAQNSGITLSQVIDLSNWRN